jgi:hypothetical protein
MECGDLPVVELLSRACEFCNPAGVFPKLNVVTVNHSLAIVHANIRGPRYFH